MGLQFVAIGLKCRGEHDVLCVSVLIGCTVRGGGSVRRPKLDDDREFPFEEARNAFAKQSMSLEIRHFITAVFDRVPLPNSRDGVPTRNAPFYF